MVLLSKRKGKGIILITPYARTQSSLTKNWRKNSFSEVPLLCFKEFSSKAGNTQDAGVETFKDNLGIRQYIDLYIPHVV